VAAAAFGGNIFSGWPQPKFISFYTNGEHPVLALMMAANVGIFALWLSQSWRRSPSKVEAMLWRHFICSRENLLAGRFHTIFTSAFSHATFLHFFLNASILDVLFRGLSTDLTSGDFATLYFTSGLAGLVQIMISNNPVLGASAVAMSLIFVDSVLHPQKTYMMIFPLPGLGITSLQLGQLSIGVNLAMTLRMILTGKQSRIAWAAHIFGSMVGAGFVAFKTHVAGERRWGNFLQLSRQYSSIHWTLTYRDYRDALRIFYCRCRSELSRNHEEYVFFENELQKLKHTRLARRAAARNT